MPPFLSYMYNSYTVTNYIFTYLNGIGSRYKSYMYLSTLRASHSYHAPLIENQGLGRGMDIESNKLLCFDDRKTCQYCWVIICVRLLYWKQRDT